MKFSHIEWDKVFFKTYFEKRSVAHLLVNFNQILWIIHVSSTTLTLPSTHLAFMHQPIKLLLLKK